MRGVSPEIADALLQFDLITSEQADEAVAQWEKEWADARTTAHWWNDLAEIAWRNEASWLSRAWNFGVPPVFWKLDWIREQRGW